MPVKESGKRTKGLSNLLRDRSTAALRALSLTQSIVNVQSLDQEDVEHITKASSDATELYTPSKPSAAADVQTAGTDAGGKEPHHPAAESILESTPKSPPSDDTQKHIILSMDRLAEESQPAPDPTQQQSPALSASLKRWIDNYDKLVEDRDTAEPFFGASPSDIIIILKFCKTLYRKCRAAGGEYDEISHEVRGLHSILRHLKYEVEAPESPVNKDRSMWRRVFAHIIEGCDSTLRQLDALIMEYKRLPNDWSDRSPTTPRILWEKMTFGSKKMDQLGGIRVKLISHVNSLTLPLDTIQMHQSVEMATPLDNHGGQLDIILDKVDDIAVKMKQRSESVMASCNDDDDDKEAWKQFRMELIADGFSSEVLQQHEDVLRAYIREIDQQGLLNEVPTDPNLPPPVGANAQHWLESVETAPSAVLSKDSVLLTSVIEPEPTLDTNTAHAYSAVSDNAASNLSADNASIFSVPESFSSISSLNDLLGPIEEFAAILIDRAELNNQYQSLRQTFEFSEFKSELHRLLKAFSRDLFKEASIPIEKESVRFVSQQRRRISHAVGQEVFGLKEKSLFEGNTLKQQLHGKERIDQFLRDLAQSKWGDGELSREGRGHDSEDDGLDNSSDDEGELENFPNFEYIKKFLIESKAFGKLRSNVKELAMYQGETKSLRLDTASDDGLKDPESSTTVMLNEKEGLHRDDLIIEKHQSATLDENTENQEIQDSSNFTPGLIQITEPIGPEAAIGDELDGRTHITGMGKIIYWRVSRYLRPKVKGGYRRLEWQCDCGAPLYGDFHDGDPREVDKLGIELQATGFESKAQENHGIQLVPASQGQSNARTPVVPGLQRSNAAKSAPAPSGSPNVQLPASSSANPGVGTTSVPAPVPHPPATKKFTALCVNTGEFSKTLGEIEVSSIGTDRQMFHKFKTTYQSLRGFRAGALRWLLIKPVDIRFIQFAVEDSHRVDIIPKPPDCTFCASDTDIRSRQYEPHLSSSARTHPPISADAFLHYWQCHVEERSLKETKWLNRVPKKLDRKLEDLRRVTRTDEDVLGWGILVIEGLNKALVTLLTFLMFLFSGVISVGYAIWRNDVSGGFAIGAYIVALWVAFITALYFQWQRD